MSIMFHNDIWNILQKVKIFLKLEIKNKNYLKFFHAQFLIDEEIVSDIAVRLSWDFDWH